MSRSATDSLSVADDYTREMVERDLAEGQKWTPNWYKLGFGSRNELKQLMNF